MKTTVGTKYWIKAFFYSPQDITDLEPVRLVEYADILNTTVTLTVNEAVSTFSMSFVNSGLKYLRDDSIEETLSAYSQLEAGSSEPNEAYTFNWFRNKNDFLNFKHETVKDGDNRYRIHYTISPTDLNRNENKNRPLDFRSLRWFFKPIAGGDGEQEAVFVQVAEGPNNTLLYTEAATGRRLNVEVHTNAEFYRPPINGSLKKTTPVIRPMDYVFLFAGNELDELGNPIYRQIFTGLVNKVSRNYRPGSSDSITIDGEDITKLMRLSVFAINPALFQVPMTNGNIDPFFVRKDLFANQSASSIIREMVLGTPTDLVFTNMESNLTRTAYKETNFVETKTYFTEKDFTTNFIKGRYFTAGNVIIQDPTDPSLDLIPQYTPYRLYFGNRPPDVFSEYKTHLEICKDVAKIMNFEFFADVYGIIHYRQPQYDTYHILNAKDPKTYILDDASLFSVDTSEDDGQVVTVLRVNGAQDVLENDSFVLGNYGVIQSRGYATRYGVRPFDIQIPLVQGQAQCELAAKSLLRKINADINSAQATLLMRPSLMPGNPVYIPSLNRVFYATTVTHSYTAGSTCQTSLGLQYGRVPWDILPELLAYYPNEKVEPYGIPTSRIEPEMDVNFGRLKIRVTVYNPDPRQTDDSPFTTADGTNWWKVMRDEKVMGDPFKARLCAISPTLKKYYRYGQTIQISGLPEPYNGLWRIHDSMGTKIGGVPIRELELQAGVDGFIDLWLDNTHNTGLWKGECIRVAEVSPFAAQKYKRDFNTENDRGEKIS